MKKRLRFTTQETFKRTPKLLTTETPLRIVRNMYVSVSRYPNYEFEYIDNGIHITNIDTTPAIVDPTDYIKEPLIDPDAMHIIDIDMNDSVVTDMQYVETITTETTHIVDTGFDDASIIPFVDKFTVTSETIHLIDIDMSTIDISVYDQYRLSITDPDAVRIIDTGFDEVSITQFTDKRVPLVPLSDAIHIIDAVFDKVSITQFTDKRVPLSDAIHVVDINFNDTIITVV